MLDFLLKKQKLLASEKAETKSFFLTFILNCQQSIEPTLRRLFSRAFINGQTVWPVCISASESSEPGSDKLNQDL